MQQLRLAFLLLQPSSLSLIITFLLSVGVLGLANYSYFTKDKILHDYFYGEYGMITTFQNYVDSLTQRYSFLSDQSHLYNLTVLVAALAAGLLTYLALQGLTKLLSIGLNDYIAVQEATGEERQHVAKEAAVRWTLRIVALAGWAVHWFLFAGVLLPFCILLTRVEVNDLLVLSSWVYGLLGVSLLYFGIHMHVIFMRALVLRPRLFGGVNEIVEIMERRHIDVANLARQL